MLIETPLPSCRGIVVKPVNQYENGIQCYVFILCTVEAKSSGTVEI